MSTKALKIGQLSGARRFVVFIAVIGILLQSYITQTHIHFGAPEISGIFKTASHAPTPKQGPLDKAAECPLCQAIVHAGAFVAPSAPLVYLSFGWVKAARFAFAAPSASGDVAHDWQGRAPPRS